MDVCSHFVIHRLPRTEGCYRVIHRSAYIEILYKEARRLGATFIFGSEVQNIDASRNTITLKNGDTYSADVIVGADGMLRYLPKD